MLNDIRTTTDPALIRNWVERRFAHGAVVVSKRDDAPDDVEVEVGSLRIIFPGYAGFSKTEPLTWDNFFEKFEAQALAFRYRDQEANGEISYDHEFIAR